MKKWFQSNNNCIQKAQILENQRQTASTINSLIELSNESLLCGPDCQKRKTANELEQKYISAQAEIKTAPINLENAKKNYYIFTEGENTYNEMLEKELQEKANEIGKLISDSFNSEIEKAKLLNKYLNTDIINSLNTLELYKDYLKKNEKTEKKIKFSQGDILTNDRKSFYESQEKDSLKGWYNIFLFVYYLVALLHFNTIFSNSNLSILFKIAIFILLCIIPFIIDGITVLILGLLKKIFDLVPKNVYLNDKNKNKDKYKS
jgi:hypothetical protein